MQKKVLAIFLALAMFATFLTAFAVPSAAVVPQGEYATDAEGNMVIPYASSTPVIDGIVDEGEWDNALTLSVTHDNATWFTSERTYTPAYASSALVKSQDYASATFSYMWGDEGLYLKVNVNDPTPSWTNTYMSPNNGADGVQIVLDPTGNDVSGEKAILTLSAYSTFSGNGDSTVCLPSDDLYPDKPFWSELWGYCPDWAESDTNDDGEIIYPTQALVPMRSKVERYDASGTGAGLDSVSTVVSSYVIELCITNEFFSYNDKNYTVQEGGTIKLGNIVLDYFHRIAGAFTNTQGGPSYQRLHDCYGDINQNTSLESNGLGFSSTYNTFVFGERTEVHEHSYANWVHDVDSAPSTHTGTCSCGDTLTEACVFDEGVLSEDQTYITYTCTVCGYSYIENNVSVSITGNPYYGETVTATVANAPEGAELHYQWTLDGENIGKDVATYTIYTAALNKNLAVTVTSSDGTVNVTSESVLLTKAPQAAPGMPILVSKTDTSVTLQAIPSREYSKDGINWQSSNVFTDLWQNTEYNFYARMAETAGYQASPASSELVVFTERTPSDITVDLSSDALYAETLTPVITGAPEDAEISYVWYLDDVPTKNYTSAYTVYMAAYGKIVTCVVTIDGVEYRSGGYIAKPSQKTPPQPPVLESRTSTSISVVTVPGVEYTIDNGKTWQTSGTFTDLEPGTIYTIYNRRPATLPNYAASIARKLKVITEVEESDFTVTLSGNGAYATDLKAEISGISTEGQTITYQWQRGDAAVGADSDSYTCYLADIGQEVTVTVIIGDKVAVSNAVIGTKGENAPSVAPVLMSRTATEITLEPVAGREYSIDGIIWQTSNVFTGLTPDTEYSVYMRRGESKAYFAGAPSKPCVVRTLAE